MLSKQRSKDESRIRSLERRLNELLVQRAEMEKEMEVTRGAMKRVEGNVKALCVANHRMRAGTGRQESLDSVVYAAESPCCTTRASRWATPPSTRRVMVSVARDRRALVTAGGLTNTCPEIN